MKYHRITEHDCRMIVALRDDVGMKLYEIAEWMGLSIGSVSIVSRERPKGQKRPPVAKFARGNQDYYD